MRPTARPVLRHLCRSFGSVVVITFERRLFADLSQDTLLVLCDVRGGPFRQLRLVNLADQWQLENLLEVDPQLSAGRSLEAESVLAGEERALAYLLPAKSAYPVREPSEESSYREAGRQFSVEHWLRHGEQLLLSPFPGESIGSGHPRVFPATGGTTCGRTARPCSFRRGPFGLATDCEAVPAGDPCRRQELPESVRAYLAEGERQGVHRAYKCRMREPWFTVPGVHAPDAFLTYMAHMYPRLVVNEAGATAPNSLLIGTRKRSEVRLRYLALAMMTSLSLLSAELEGHSLGGGLLKLEPREACRLRIPVLNTASLSRVESLR